MKKKLIALLICVCMLLSFVQANLAFSIDTEQTRETVGIPECDCGNASKMLIQHNDRCALKECIRNLADNSTAAEIYSVWHLLYEHEQNFLLEYLGWNWYYNQNKLNQLLRLIAEGGSTEPEVVEELDGYTVSVAGGTKVSVTSSEIPEGAEGLFAQDYNHWQLTIDIDADESSDGVTVEISDLDIPQRTTAAVYHFLTKAEIAEAIARDADIRSTEDGIIFEVLPALVDSSEGTVTFKTYTFSVFTVDFYYNAFEYHLEGMESILLSELFEILGIEQNVSNVISCTFTDNDLISVDEQDNGDYLLTSKGPFLTKENLEITFSTGEKLNVLVTDKFTDNEFVTGHIRIKVNVLDWETRLPIPGVQVGINRIGTCPGGSVNSIMTGISESDGAAYIDRTYTLGYIGGQPVVYLDGIQDDRHIIYDTRPAYSGNTGIRFDMVPLSSGYSLDVTTSDKIRNCKSGSHGGAVPLTVGAGGPRYDDFIFHSGMQGSGAYIEFDLYVKANMVTVQYEDRYIDSWNPANYLPVTVNAGTIISAPYGTPINSKNSDIEFLGWADKATGEIFNFSNPVTGNMTLIPKWGPNPDAKGYIHLDSFLWDHDAYNGTYRTGQTETTVNELEYVIEYYDQANAVTSNWHTLTTVTVDQYGKADIVLTPEMLQELGDFYDSIKNLPPINGEQHRVAIDIGPSSEHRGWHEVNQRPLNYAWDWVQYNYEWFHGAGLTGVRMMWVNADENPCYDIDRINNEWTLGKGGDHTTPTVGNVMYASNVNHVPWLTEGMLGDGFEIYWKCYVAPAVTVNFDLDGGTGTGDYSEQKLRPINSLPEQRSDFLVRNPGGTVTKSNKIFVGWYKENADDSLESSPWDFANRVVTESMTLRAVYTEKLYKVRFDTPENGNQDNNHKVGDTPTWVGTDPVKSPNNGYCYVFTGWKETTGTHVGAEYTFGEDYDFDHQVRTIFGSGASAPVTIDNTFADLTVYTAQFVAIPLNYTLKYDTDGGSGSFGNQNYSVADGVTIYDAEPVKAGYQFNFWELKTTDGNWDSRVYNPGDTVTNKYGNTTLIARYNPLYSYQLNFDQNTTDTVTSMPGTMTETDLPQSIYTMSWTTEPVRDGYTFLGWADSQTGSVVVPAGTKSYQMSGIPAMLKEQTLYAVWQINECPYTVEYLEYGTNRELHSPKVGSGAVGSTITENAISISGYEVFGENEQSIEISATAENKIVFKYKGKPVVINYIAVPSEGGSVSLDTEEINVITGVASGSIAVANPGYRFVGWYSDEACTNKISGDDLFIPKKNASGMFEAATYYAKFEEILGKLTVVKTGCSAQDTNQSFIFKIKSNELLNTAHDAVELYVTVQGNGSVTVVNLPVGTYLVEEVDSWSWRYEADTRLAPKNVEVDEDGETVTVSNTRTNANWLSGADYAINTVSGRKVK